MRPGGGKGKGGGFERDTCAKLSLWLSEGKRKDLLCRTVGSGAQFTTVNRGHAADIMAQDDPIAFELCKRYTIECKFWRDLKFIQFLSGKGELYKELEKLKKTATKVNKDWWYIVKQNHQRDLLLTEFSTSSHILSRFDGVVIPYHQLFSGSILLFYLDEFLKAVTPQRYMKGYTDGP